MLQSNNNENNINESGGFDIGRRRIFFILSAGLLTVLSKPLRSLKRKPFVKSQFRKNIARKYFKAIWTGDFSSAEKLVSSGYVMSGGDNKVRARGFHAAKSVAKGYSRSFSNIKIRISKITREGNRVSLSWSWTGIHTSIFKGIKPTHKRVTAHGVSTIEFRGNTVKSERYVYDSLDFYNQLGSLPKK